MTLLDWFDFVRVAAAVAVVFLVLPLVARRLGDRAVHPWYLDIAPSFVYASVFFQVTATILGNWRLCYGGLVAVVVVGWLAATVAFASRRRWIWDGAAWQSGFLRAFEWLEGAAWKPLVKRVNSTQALFDLTQTVLLFGALFVIVFLDRTGFALANSRFLGAQSYERALSLQTLVHGGAWVRDGSVAMFAPIVHFSGVNGSTVIRFTGPVFSLLLVVAGGYCAWCYTRRRSAAFIAGLLLGVYPALLGFDSPGEAAGPELAALYWVLALALARTSWRYALAAGVAAYMIHPQFSSALAGAILCVSAGVLFSVVSRVSPRFLAAPAGAAGVAAATLLLLRSAGAPAVHAAYQYESAARAAEQIARELPRNKWMIVSPAQELSSTYGRGWHLQITEFVRRHSPAQVSRPDFRFAYTVDDLFVFVEKEPLRQSSRTAAMAADEYSYQYFTGIGRTTLQFQAAQLMEAYASAHRDASVYSEDDQLVVYRVAFKNPRK